MSYDDDMDTAHDTQEQYLIARAMAGKDIVCDKCGLSAVPGGQHVCLKPIDTVLGTVPGTRTGASIVGNGDDTEGDDLYNQDTPYHTAAMVVAGIIAGIAVAAAVAGFIVLVLSNLP